MNFQRPLLHVNVNIFIELATYFLVRISIRTTGPVLLSSTIDSDTSNVNISVPSFERPPLWSANKSKLGKSSAGLTLQENSPGGAFQHVKVSGGRRVQHFAPNAYCVWNLLSVRGFARMIAFLRVERLGLNVDSNFGHGFRFMSSSLFQFLARYRPWLLFERSRLCSGFVQIGIVTGSGIEIASGAESGIESLDRCRPIDKLRSLKSERGEVRKRSRCGTSEDFRRAINLMRRQAPVLATGPASQALIEQIKTRRGVAILFSARLARERGERHRGAAVICEFIARTQRDRIHRQKELKKKPAKCESDSRTEGSVQTCKVYKVRFTKFRDSMSTGSASYLHAFLRKRVLTDGRTDGQTDNKVIL
ncbi:hypothetical protein EVAR_6114_1 [Eumeta japonica]|uniref:Uncharacterized protein n=1 Tax=Eumeta variegata TaxID=151549 RepID=A0A4C1TF08_EUMVA|nr:hypothetical protein EVAR_6114_1 [Eumeta japonica]